MPSVFTLSSFWADGPFSTHLRRQDPNPATIRWEDDLPNAAGIPLEKSIREI